MSQIFFQYKQIVYKQAHGTKYRWRTIMGSDAGGRGHGSNRLNYQTRYLKYNFTDVYLTVQIAVTTVQIAKSY